MKKLSRTFLIVGGVLAIVGIFGFLIFGAAFFYISQGVSDDFIKDAFADIWDRVRGTDDEEKIETIRFFARNIGIVVLCAAVLSIPTAIVCFTAAGKQTQGSFIATIVFNVICGSVFGILGGVFGLIANSKERNARLANQDQ